jgi:hypothetical protein
MPAAKMFKKIKLATNDKGQLAFKEIERKQIKKCMY